MKVLAVSVTALVSTAFAAGCASQPPPAPQAPAPTLFTGAAPVEPTKAVPDDRITNVVRREFGQDPLVARERIGVQSQNGVVTLDGTVSNQAVIDRALAIVPVVKGVRAIVDRLSIATAKRPDAELDFAVAASLAGDPALDKDRVAAATHDGIVRLTGDVGSFAARKIAVEDVLTVPGVRGVVDNLAFVPPDDRTDQTIAAQASRVIKNDPWLDDSHVDVSVDHGNLVLSGYVGNAAERARAEADAHTANPAHVDCTGLRIDRVVDDGTLRAEPLTSRPDRELVQSLSDAYVQDPRVHPFVPGIDVHNGVIVLTGIAPDEQAARAAYEDASHVTGVVQVRDAVRIASRVHATDSDVRTNVVSAIRRDPRLAAAGVSVDVRSGTVILRGSVDTDQSRIEAVTLASSIPGVRDVLDQLAVNTPRIDPPTVVQVVPPTEGTGRAESQGK